MNRRGFFNDSVHVASAMLVMSAMLSLMGVGFLFGYKNEEQLKGAYVILVMSGVMVLACLTTYAVNFVWANTYGKKRFLVRLKRLCKETPLL